MATHQSVLSWRFPGTEEPDRLLSVGRTESDVPDGTQNEQQQQQQQKQQELVPYTDWLTPSMYFLLIG